MNKYWYCSVNVKGVNKSYTYISDIGRIGAGTYVEVPFGKENKSVIGVVDAAGEYTDENVPYPVEKTKHILRIATELEYETQIRVEYDSYHNTSDYDNYENCENYDNYDDHENYDYYDNCDNCDDCDDCDDCGDCGEADDMDGINYYIDECNWNEVLAWAIRNHNTTDERIARKVMRCYELCAEQGMPIAFLNLGTFYYNGRLVERDFKKAYELYKIAADAGELRAICNCGYCFYYGRHQEIDYNEAFKYFSAGALLFDDANCLYKLGDMYLNGYSVDKNEKYAFMLYTRALEMCRKNDDECTADVQFRVGKCLIRGIGTPVKAEIAHELLCVALINFYKKLKTDSSVSRLIESTKKLIAEAQEKLENEI